MSADEPDDLEQTIIRPSPGGRRMAPLGPLSEPMPRGSLDSQEFRRIDQAGINPLVGAASSLLALIIRLRDRATHRDIEELRERVIGEIRMFETAALAAGMPPEQIRAARYALAATVDDLVLNTPWGSQGIWAHRGMVSTLYNETSGGERFFDILQQLERDAGRNADVLELYYLCLSLGFEGKYRILPRGSTELNQVRDNLFRLLRTRRDEIERELSPHWRGVAAAHRPLRAVLPLWVVLVVLAGLLTALFWGFSYALNRDSDVVFASLQSVVPDGPVEIVRPEPIVVQPPPPPPPEPVDDLLTRVSRFLQPEIQQGLVTVSEDARSIIIRIPGATMFGSGTSTVDDTYVPLIERIGAALETEPGAVVVVGHTDNVPIRTLRFPSNWHLSVARAESVMNLLAGTLSQPGRLSAEGHADAEPIAPNTTPEGREANRRIEILLMKSAP